MKLGLKALMVGALAAALLVPTAVAKPGNGQGHGAEKAHGKPAWAGQGQERKAENAARKEARRAARSAPDSEEPEADVPKHDNPAWICKFEREQMGTEAFAEAYGANENKANAFGKCVSREAHDRDGVTPAEETTPGPAEEEPAPAEGGDEGDELGDEALAALEALFQALRQLVF
jgi:hypothetical protein